LGRCHSCATAIHGCPEGHSDNALHGKGSSGFLGAAGLRRRSSVLTIVPYYERSVRSAQYLCVPNYTAGSEPESGGGRSTGQTLGDQGTESRRDLSAWDVGRCRAEGAGSLVRACLIDHQDHKLAGLPEVTPVRVTGGARPFLFAVRGRRGKRPLEGELPYGALLLVCCPQRDQLGEKRHHPCDIDAIELKKQRAKTGGI
jgi:hypothetical protein